VSNTSISIAYVGGAAVIIADARQARLNSERRALIVAAGVSRPAGSISHHRCAGFRTQRLTPADPFRDCRGLPDTTKGEVMGKLEGKVAVVTGGSSGMALASAKLFVEEGAYVFITGRRQEALDEAVKLIGRNVTGVRGDAANLDDLDRLFDTVKREKGRIDVLYASAGTGEAVPLGEITEQHFDAAFGLNTRGTLFTVQKALPLFNDGGSIFMTGSVASIKGFPGYSVYAGSKAALHAFARGWLNELKGRNIRVNVLHPGPIATPMQDQVLDEEGKRMFESLIPRGKMGRPEEIATVALFLASDDSSFVNGLELSVDGGFSAI
jgi:NAD(P)-dependent dehydrogenase (short-subunit alcohol dehydrogenase family)